MNNFFNSNNKVIAPTSELTSAVINDLTLENDRKPENILLPRGSALMTTSGQLLPDIIAILHAATGTMNQFYSPWQPYFDPSLQSVENALIACFELCKLNGHKRMAIPYIGGKIFKDRIFEAQKISEEEKDSKLVACIVNATITNAHSSGCGYCFIAYDDNAYALFSSELKRSHSDVDIDNHLKKGDIVDFQLHNCDVIVNAANMEVEFGGGISGAIAQATHNKSNIDQEAKVAIHHFWNEYKGS